MIDRFHPADAMPSVIGRLIVCDCGHGIGAHGTGGCRSESLERCDCAREPGWILNRAVDVAALELAAAMPPTARRPGRLPVNGNRPTG